jgi:hypothetical protein
VLLFLGAGVRAPDELVAAHRALHARHPDPLVAVQGALAWAPGLDVTPFMAWLARATFPPRFAPEFGELGIAALDLRHFSIKRALLHEMAAEPLTTAELAYRLGERPTRLLAGPAAHVTRPLSEDDARTALPRLLAEEDAFLRAHPHVESYLRAPLEDASRLPPLRGRTGRALLTRTPAGLPILGDRVWRNADVYYRQKIAEALPVQEGT